LKVIGRIVGPIGDDGLAIRSDPNGETTLSGRLMDQAALFGVLAKIHHLNLILISVNRSTQK